MNLETAQCRTEEMRGITPREGLAFSGFRDRYFAMYGGCNENVGQCYSGLYLADLRPNGGRDLEFNRVELDDQGSRGERIRVELMPKVEGATMVETDDGLVLFGGCEMLKKCSNEVLIFGSQSLNLAAYAQEDATVFPIPVT